METKANPSADSPRDATWSEKRHREAAENLNRIDGMRTFSGRDGMEKRKILSYGDRTGGHDFMTGFGIRFSFRKIRGNEKISGKQNFQSEIPRGLDNGVIDMGVDGRKIVSIVVAAGFRML